jgi:hypothetical protein
MATRWDNLPGLKDDVIERTKEDLRKSEKGRNVDSSKLTGGAKDAVREAGARATNRNIGRAGAAQAALEAGYAAGRALDENGIPFTGGVGKGVGKKLVEKSGLGKIAEKAASARDKVELSRSAKDRLEDEEVDSAVREVMAREKAGEFSPERGNSDAMKRGGSVKTAKYMSFSKTGKPAGMKPVTKMASGGMTASRRADGIATKGKTKGRFV